MAEEVIGLLFGVDGGGSIDGRSGQQIVSDLTKIVNKINSGKSTVPKVQLKFDTSNVKTALKELKAQLREIAGMGSVSVSGMPSRGGSGGSAGVKQDTGNYRALTATVKQYYAALAEVEKIQMKSTAVSSSGGVWSTTDTQYDARIEKINQLKMEFDGLGVIVDDVGNVEMHSAQQLNITEEQRAMLLTQVQSAITANGLAHEKSAAQISAAWDKNADKATQYVRRIEDVASKNADVKESMDKVLKLAASGDPKNLDALTKELAKLQQKVRETEADVKTWGDRFKKTFGNEVRSVLAATLVAVATKYLREVYTNVVNLDKALVNLQIASGKTREETKELVKEYADLAKTLGATTAEVADAADTWLRQGYSTEEANTLITNSMMLSKLGQMESAEASKALTSAMKGYGVAVEDSVQIVDKLTKVDMEAAASAGDIATAMAETATSAKLSGVSMDALIGYITTVKEVTQDGSESVGVFFKTLFARMNNVAAGKFIDDETGESLNDVEAVLGNLGIALRGVNGEFRNSSDVLDDVAARWDTFNDTERNAIATAMAGTRNFEKFNVLMSNYGTAMGYAAAATEAGGTAVEKFGAYTEGVEGKMNSLKASFEALSMAVINSELITGAVGFISWILDALTWVIDKIGGLNTILYLTLGILATIKADSIFSFITGVIPKIIGLVTTLWSNVATLAATFVAAKASGMTMGQSVSAAFKAIGVSASTAQVAVGAFVAVLGICLIAVNSYNQAVRESINNSLSAANAANTEGKEYLKNAESIGELVKEYEALAEANDGVFSGESAERVRSIQNKITDLVGDQADNLDLVNGKLDDEIRKMRELATGTGGAVDNAIKQGNTQIAEATNAYKEMVGSAFASDYLIVGEALTSHLWGAWETGGVTDFTKEWTDQFNVELQKNKLFSEGFGMEKGYGYGFKTEFDTIEEFAKQYEGISAMYKELSAEHGDSELFKTASTFLADYKSIYETYMSGKLLIEEANKVKDEVNDLFAKPEDNGVTVALKSAYEILEEVQDGYDGLASALTDVTSEGYLTADALATLFKLEKDNALAGLKLADILTQDANGYKLAGNALEKYVQALISAYTVEGAFASQKDKENAVANLENLRSVLATLMATQEESTDANKAYREELEKEQDMYEDQLDKFEELIDLRKDLLQTYKEELDYQKELEKRQRNVTALQTKLSVARLDQSAAGQARVRELEAELKSAQEDLEDFTLEHAIDVLTDQLESTNAEWKAIIQGKLNEITQLLEGLDTTPEVNITTDTSWMQNAMSTIEGMIANAHGKEVVDNSGGGTGATKTRWTSYQDAADAGYSNIRTRSEFGRGNNPDKQKYGTYQAYLDGMYEKYMGKAPVYHSGGLVGNIATLSSSEEFAKLLKGEFVSTPTQMKRFMEETLPKIANYSATGGSNEFNAPLIEITCESVTTEALPELERIVNEAVKEIKRELDSGMSRTGFKRTPTKRLT